jgi:hypothetical protein
MKYTNCPIGNLRPENHQAEQAEQANKLKRPKRTSQIRRHTEINNLAFLAKVLELKWPVALVAVNNKQLVTTHCTGLCMLDKVLQPGKTKLVSGPAVLADADPPIWGVVVTLGLIMVLCFEDEEGWDRPPHGVDASDQSYPLTVTRLNTKWLKASLRRSNYLSWPSNTYLEASIVEVVGIFV